MKPNTQTHEPLAYQVLDFCRRVGIGRTAFYKSVNAGKIRIVRIGGRTLVPADEVKRLLAGAA